MTTSMVASGVEALLSAYQRDEISCMLFTYQTPITVTKPIQWVFSISPGSSNEAAAVVSWFDENWTEDRRPKVGAVHYDHASGWESLEGVKEACERLDVEFVGYESVPMLGVIDTSVEWLRMKGKQPDLVYVTASGMTLAVLIKDAARLEVKGKEITLASCPYLDETIIPVVGEDAEGWYYIASTPGPVETELPGMKTALEVLERDRGIAVEKISTLDIRGWITAMIQVEAVRLAVEKAGLENLTGRTARDALASITDFDTGLVPPITMTNEAPYAAKKMRVSVVKGGKIIPHSEWFEPNIRIMFK